MPNNNKPPTRAGGYHNPAATGYASKERQTTLQFGKKGRHNRKQNEKYPFAGDTEKEIQLICECFTHNFDETLNFLQGKGIKNIKFTKEDENEEVYRGWITGMHSPGSDREKYLIIGSILEGTIKTHHYWLPKDPNPQKSIRYLYTNKLISVLQERQKNTPRAVAQKQPPPPPPPTTRTTTMSTTQ